MLDAIVGLNKRDGNGPSITHQDRRFLKSLKIRIDEESLENGGEIRLAMTPQDIKFLKSLRISVDDIDD